MRAGRRLTIRRHEALAVEQLLNRAIANAEIVDILGAVGIQSPDLSILSPEFLSRNPVDGKKNLASPLDGGTNRYAIRFPGNDLPPAKQF